MNEIDLLIKLAKTYHCSIGQILCSVEGWNQKEPKDKKKALEDAIARMDVVHDKMVEVRRELTSSIEALNA